MRNSKKQKCLFTALALVLILALSGCGGASGEEGVNVSTGELWDGSGSEQSIPQETASATAGMTVSATAPNDERIELPASVFLLW